MPEKVPSVNQRILCCLMLMFSLVSFFCAGRMQPTGGPPDTTPPVIIKSFPEPGMVHTVTKSVKLEFSKYVDHGSLQGSVFFSPNLGALTFDWGSTEVEIHFSDSLKQNTTIIMTIGTDLVDTHGNHLAKAFSLPFSSGDQIDSGAIAGSVIDQKPDGVMLYAWRTDQPPRRGDTLNPSDTKPDYLTQTSANGSFILPYLAIGTYRVIAVRDEMRNLLYDVQSDQYGTPISDITLTPGNPHSGGVLIRMTSEDTTAPYLSSARAIDREHVLLRFSKPMDWTSVQSGECSITDTLSGNKLEVRSFAMLDPDNLSAMLVTALQESLRAYRVVPGNLKDSHGLPMRSLPVGDVFTASSDRDTSRPSFELISPSHQSEEVGIDDSIHFSVSEPVIREKFQKGVFLSDSSGKQIPLKFTWRSDAVCYCMPEQGFRFNTKYRLSIVLDSVIDYSGNKITDSMKTYGFQTIAEENLSSIQGVVSDTMMGASGFVVITATNIAHPNMRPKTLQIDKPGSFQFNQCLEGMYTLEAFRDADSNGSYSYGKPFPFHPSERFVIYPDTLKLRARWPLEGVQLRFR